VSNKLAKRKPGGQPGNLSACRSPWRSFWKRRALRPDDAYILPLVDSLAAGLISDLGGPDAITAAQAVLIRNLQTAQACALLCMSRIGTDGPFRISQTGETVSHPALKEIGRFLGEIRQSATALGLERKTRDVTNLADYLKARDEVIPVEAVEVE
jgi:hypothetical protein